MHTTVYAPMLKPEDDSTLVYEPTPLPIAVRLVGGLRGTPLADLLITRTAEPPATWLQQALR